MTRMNMSIHDIQVTEPFSTLFPVHHHTLDAITENMKSSGFDDAFPIIIWEDKNIIVDGHTRLSAASRIKIGEVPVLLKKFKSQDEAILYAFHLQRNRRNLADEDILRCLQVLDTLDPELEEELNGDILTQKEKTEIRAQELGTSKHKIDQARTLIKHGSPDIMDSVSKGEKSIGKAYQDVQNHRRESGELKGPQTTGLASSKTYKKALTAFTKQISHLKEDGWNEVSMDMVLKDLESLIHSVDNF